MNDNALPSGGPPLRVVAITPTGVFSGAERVLLNHALTGRELGDTWTILTPSGPTSERLASDGVDHLLIPELKLGSGPRPAAALLLAARNLTAFRTVRRVAKDADVIVANSVLCLPLLRLIRGSVPIVWLVHDVITRSDLRLMAKATAGAVTRSVPVSEAAGQLSRDLGIETTVVYNGVNVDAPDLEPTDPPIVGLNAVLTHWKGQHVLIDAAALVEHDCTIELLGGRLPKDDDYADHLSDLVEQKHLGDKVRLLGHHDEPPNVMRRWTVAVSASVEPEAGPLSILEAMALGIPVIVSDHGAAPEMIGDCGVAVPVGDSVALAAAIDEMLDDLVWARTLGRSGRDRMRSLFRRHDRVHQFRSVLRDVARSRSMGVSP